MRPVKYSKSCRECQNRRVTNHSSNLKVKCEGGQPCLRCVQRNVVCTFAPKLGKRSTAACANCRDKKIKCLGGEDEHIPCQSCAEKGIECIKHVTGRRGPKPGKRYKTSVPNDKESDGGSSSYTAVKSTEGSGSTTIDDRALIRATVSTSDDLAKTLINLASVNAEDRKDLWTRSQPELVGWIMPRIPLEADVELDLSRWTHDTFRNLTLLEPGSTNSLSFGNFYFKYVHGDLSTFQSEQEFYDNFDYLPLHLLHLIYVKSILAGKFNSNWSGKSFLEHFEYSVSLLEVVLDQPPTPWLLLSLFIAFWTSILICDTKNIFRYAEIALKAGIALGVEETLIPWPTKPNLASPNFNCNNFAKSVWILFHHVSLTVKLAYSWPIDGQLDLPNDFASELIRQNANNPLYTKEFMLDCFKCLPALDTLANFLISNNIQVFLDGSNLENVIQLIEDWEATVSPCLLDPFEMGNINWKMSYVQFASFFLKLKVCKSAVISWLELGRTRDYHNPVYIHVKTLLDAIKQACKSILLQQNPSVLGFLSKKVVFDSILLNYCLSESLDSEGNVPGNALMCEVFGMHFFGPDFQDQLQGCDFQKAMKLLKTS